MLATKEEELAVAILQQRFIAAIGQKARSLDAGISSAETIPSAFENASLTTTPDGANLGTKRGILEREEYISIINRYCL